jgi:hypothetical protein
MRRRFYVAAGILAVFAVGACSHSSGGGSASANGGAGDAVRVPAAPAGGIAGAPASHGTVFDGSQSSSVSKASVKLPIDGSYKIRTAQMTVAVKGAKNVATKANEAESIVEQVGGEVDADDRTSGPDASASLRLLVPPEELTDTLKQLSTKLGHERSRELSTTDVTQKVADVNSRVASARESIARLRVLFANAKKVADVIAIESELNTREAELESLEAQQRALERETSMATINLSLVTAPKHPTPPPKKHEEHLGGFLGGLERGWDGFTAAASWVATAVGTLLPFLVLLLLLGIGARMLRPRLPRRHPTTPAPTPSE